MNKWQIIYPLVVITILAAAVALVRGYNNRGSLAAYHLREFECIKTNFNNYKPSLSERLQGIGDNKDKWDYHLGKLEELGVVAHQTFVFTNRLYTRETSKQIWSSAWSNFPSAVMLSAKYYATNDPGYGKVPYRLEVWDFPSNMQHWASFYRTNN